MAYNPNIQLGAPPLLWSDMNEVLVQINQNFDYKEKSERKMDLI
jgi:hypothetical protein